VNDKTLIKDTDWASKLQKDLSQYIDELTESIDTEYQNDDDIPETVTGAPYCGCDTCHYREILAYTIPKIIQGYKEGKIELSD
jgi:hypothetical protein